MRKRTIKCAADTIFWYILYLFPLLYFGIYIIAFGHSGGSFLGEDGTLNRAVLSFSNFINIIGAQPSSSTGKVYFVINQIFGQNGVFPLFQGTSTPLMVCAYFINVFLLHLVVDFLLFIPKLAMKWMNHFTNTED